MSAGNRFPVPQTAEERAEFVATYFDPGRVSDQFRQVVTELRADFRLLKKGDRIMECRTWTEFCQKVLKRTDRAVRYIIAGGNPRSKRHERFDSYALWLGMPGFESEDLQPHRTLYIHFESERQVRKFAELVGQPITPKTRYLWYPKAKRGDHGSAAIRSSSLQLHPKFIDTLRDRDSRPQDQAILFEGSIVDRVLPSIPLSSYLYHVWVLVA